MVRTYNYIDMEIGKYRNTLQDNKFRIVPINKNVSLYATNNKINKYCGNHTDK